MDHTEFIKKAWKNSGERTVRKLILSNILRNPDKKAIVTDLGAFELTYREFLSEAANLGAHFRRLGFVDRKVALVGKTDYIYVLALVTAFISNITAIPVDQTLSKEMIVSRIRQSDADIVLYDPKILGSEDIAAGYSFDEVRELSHTMCKEEELNAWAGEKTDGSEEALMIFSSGTGGKIKACVLTQENLTVERSVQTKLYQPDHFGLFYLPPCHIIGIVDLTGCLFIGNTVYICAGLSEILKEFQYVKPEIVRMVPAQAEFFAGLLSEKNATEGRELLGGRLKSVRTSGAPLPGSVADVFEKFDISVASDYGMTEAAGPVAVADIKDGHIYEAQGSSGRVIDDVTVRIEPLKGQEYGEIKIKGYSLFSRYYGDEEATKEAFDGEWYRTGDLGYIDKDGYLFIVGRKKNLIILSSGENIIPEELEAEIRAFSGVRECRVFEKDGMLALEIYPEEGSEEASVRRKISEFNRKNPSFRRITVLIISKIPLKKTATGKIKRS